MSELTKWTRRTNSPSFRKVTPRESGSPSPQPRKHQAKSKYIPPTPPNKPENIPRRIRKKDLLPSNPTAPVPQQFGEIVKKSASIILKTISISYPDLKKTMSKNYDHFYSDFSNWLATEGFKYTRKRNEPLPSLNILQAKHQKSAEKLSALMQEARVWSKADPGDFSFVFLGRQDEPFGYIERPLVCLVKIRDFIKEVDLLSIYYQVVFSRVSDVQNQSEDVSLRFRNDLAINYSRQVQIARLIYAD